MSKCLARTKSGRRCAIDAANGKPWCHTHDPEGNYRLQHPGMPAPALYAFPHSLIGVRDWQLG